MRDNDLVTPSELDSFPGAPFSYDLVDAAVALLRHRLGWHVSPQVTETVTLDSNGGRYLFLPSQAVASVTAVRDVSETTPVTIQATEYRLARTMLVRRSGCWPIGEAVVEVDMVHGFASCPPDLLQAVAEACQAITRAGGVTSVQIDDYSETYASGGVVGGPIGGTAADYYRVPRRTR